jgi:hypothetical protein
MSWYLAGIALLVVFVVLLAIDMVHKNGIGQDDD